MRRSPVQILLVLAVAGALLAALVIASSGDKSSASYNPEKLFPLLQIDDIVRIEITAPEYDATLLAANGGWGVDSRSGYPADAEKLRRLVLGVAGLTPTDRMTDKPEKYARVGVAADIPASGHLRFLNGGDEVLVDLALGDLRKGKPQGPGGFSPTQGQYVRAEGDPWVYLITSEIQIEERAQDWLEREVMDVAEADLTRIAIDHVDSTETLAIARAEGDAFSIETTIPNGYEQTDWSVVAMAKGLSGLTLEDVFKADGEKSEGLEFDIRFVATNRDGVAYTAATGKRDDKRYLKLSAAVAGTVSSAEPLEAIDNESVEPEQTPAASVAEFTRKHSPWIYVISTTQYNGLTKKLSDVIEEKAPEADAEAANVYGNVSGNDPVADVGAEIVLDAALDALTNPDSGEPSP